MVPTKKTTETKVKIRWNKPKRTGSTKLKKYQFRLKAKGGTWKKWKGKTPKKLAVNKKQKKKQKKFKKVYKNLQPGTSYVFQVRAKNKTGNGKGAKNGLKFHTLPECKPDGPDGPDDPDGPVDPDVRPIPSVNYVYTNPNNRDGQWKNLAGELTTVQTTQFIDSIPSVITVKTPDGDGCIAIFDQFDGKPFATAGSGDPIPVNPPDGSKPQQLTIIPWQSSNGGCNINTDFASYDPNIVIAVFVSKRYFSSPPSNATVCKISASDAAAIDNMALTNSGGNQWTKGDCVIDKPRVRPLNGNDMYTGSLFTMATDGKSKELYIELEAGVVLKTPLNAMVSATARGSTPCAVTTKRPITVTGFGRLDSNITRDDYDSQGLKENQTGKYKVDTGQLIVNSSAAREFPIDVSGITISNSPRRNDTAVKLNFAPSCTPDYSTPSQVNYESNRPAKVFDVKRIVWNGESDSYEVGADSYIGNSWILSADDSIKISSTGQTFEDITVIQGGAGGVINIGSYGYNYGTAGSRVDGVYVPRILQNNGKATDPGSSGLIQTLTCPIKNFNKKQQNVTNVSVNDLTLPGLGTKDGNQMNTYSRAFSLGVTGNNAFCIPDGSVATFGDFQFTNVDLYQDPMEGNKSALYDESGTASLLPIRFCNGNDAVCSNPIPGPTAESNRPVAIWPGGTKDSIGYFMCGTDQADLCWTTTDGTEQGPSDQAAKNIEYPSGDWGNKVGFPYGPP
ncbi:MAG: fibronectin type III domain-containing protein [Actinomycetia bacterium]|nr:fibronectin type III domain-containing protein [Actinomycetes bacterium]